MNANRTASQQPLSDKQKEFVKQYLICKEGSKAARLAGYSDSGKAAFRLLRRPSVRREITRALTRQNKQYEKQLAANMEQLYSCLTREGTDIVDESTGRMLPLHSMPRRALMAMDGYEEIERQTKFGTTITRKVKFVPKASAIDMSLKIQGKYPKESGTTINVDNRQVVLRIPDNGRGPRLEQR